MVMLGVSDGSGGAGRTRALYLQHDIVFGLLWHRSKFSCNYGYVVEQNIKILVESLVC